MVLNGTITTCDSYAELKERFPQFASADGENAFKEQERENASTDHGINKEESVVCIEESLEQINMDGEDDDDDDNGGARQNPKEPGIEMISPSSSRLSTRRMQRGHSRC